MEQQRHAFEELIRQGEVLFTEGKIDESEKYFLDLLDKYPNNSELLNNLGVIKLGVGDLDLAAKHLQAALDLDTANKDALINYSTLLKHQNRLRDISPLLKKALAIFPKDSELLRLENELLFSNSIRPKIAVLCMPGLTSFLSDIVDFLKSKYDVRTCYSNNHSEIDAAVRWADIVWLEWANELAIHVTNKVQAVTGKQVICRIHSYEVLSGYLTQIDWAKVSNTIFVADHVREIALELCPSISHSTKSTVIHNGLDLNKFSYKEHKPGFNIGVVGFINHKKNPSMWIEILNRLVKIDKRYTLKVAGSLQDLRYKYYLENIISTLGLLDNINFSGQVDEIAKWFDTNDINYLLTTSVFESFGYVIAEAMAMGCRPLIHAFPSAEQIWPKDCLFGCVDDLIKLVLDRENYHSRKYREFVEDKYSLESQLEDTRKLLDETLNGSSLGAAFSKRLCCSEAHNQLNIPQALVNYHRPENTVIVTGIPRSGTSLFSALLNKLDNSVCLNEILYDVDSLPSAFAEIRNRIISGIPIPNRYDRSGNLTTDTQGSGADIEERIVPKANENVVIGSKVNIPYLNQIQKILEYGYKVIAIVRDPVYAIGSWNSKKAHAIPEAHISDNDMHPRWSNFKFTTDNKIERQAQLWNFYANLVWSLRDKIKIYTYELLTSDLEWVINDICDFLELEPPENMTEMRSQNIDSKYPKIDEIKEAVKKYCPIKNVFAYNYLDYEYPKGSEEKFLAGKQACAESSIYRKSAWNRTINYNRKPILSEKGANSSHLVIAFGGIANQLYLPPFEFFSATNSLPFSKILVRDFNQGWYHLGIDKTLNTFEAVLEKLKNIVKELNPDTICTVGTSAGGYAALAFGHFLEVDFVHALAPQTFVDQDNRERIGETRWCKEFARIYEKHPGSNWFYDLRKLLKQCNGKTVYNIHVCKSHPLDMAHAQHMESIPGIQILEYDCAVHNIARHLKDTNLLDNLLNKPFISATEVPSYQIDETSHTDISQQEKDLNRSKNHRQGRCSEDIIHQGREPSTIFQDIKTYAMFVGYPRSGHSLIGSLLDAHPNIILAHELDALSFVSEDCNRDQLFQLIMKNSQDFTEDGRKWTGYSYAVPNQWNGKSNKLEIIGDKKGGKSVWRLRSDPDILRKLQDLVRVEIKLIHILRNPFDNITTIFNKETDKGLDFAIEFYFNMVDTVAQLKKSTNGMKLHEVSLESFVANPQEQLTKLCGFLKVDTTPEYLDDCASIVFSSPPKTRHAIDWIPEKIQVVQDLIAKYSFLSGYCYES